MKMFYVNLNGKLNFLMSFPKKKKKPQILSFFKLFEFYLSLLW